MGGVYDIRMRKLECGKYEFQTIIRFIFPIPNSTAFAFVIRYPFRIPKYLALIRNPSRDMSLKNYLDSSGTKL
jgi:hypothetical protein